MIVSGSYHVLGQGVVQAHITIKCSHQAFTNNVVSDFYVTIERPNHFELLVRVYEGFKNLKSGASVSLFLHWLVHFLTGKVHEFFSSSLTRAREVFVLHRPRESVCLQLDSLDDRHGAHQPKILGSVR